MKYKDFVKRLSETLEVDEPETEEMVETYLNELLKSVAEGNVVSVQGIGNFDTKVKGERKMYNPTTKETVIIPSRRVLNFRQSAVLKEKFNK